MAKARCLVAFAGSGLPGSQDHPHTSKQCLNPDELAEPLTTLPGVGPALAAAAGKLGLSTKGDLLFHFPRRHEDYTSRRRIGELKWGEEATVACRVERVSLKRTRRRNLRLVQAMVRDETGYMQAVWFNQDYLADVLKPGEELFLRGTYDGRANTFRVISHELMRREGAGLHTTGLVPVYPTTEKISVKRLRGWLARVRHLAALLPDPLPARVRAGLGLAARADAVLTMHFPAAPADYRQAERRLIFEELFLMQVGLLARRRHLEKVRRGVRLGPPGALTQAFLEALPFHLTPDQQKVCREISADLGQPAPMQRLLQGDVGSGKTVVAVYAMLRAVEQGCQAVIMAPTEVLAEQHYFNLERMLAGAGRSTPGEGGGMPAREHETPVHEGGGENRGPELRLAFLSSRLKAGERAALLAEIAAGEVDIAVGTHSLIQEGVGFARLGVVVVDEQHLFGVSQRDQLTGRATRRGLTPHVLHMTATPIPRTLALTLYGDLEVSTIRTMPPGRRPVRTWQVGEEKRAGAYRFIRGKLDEGRQCYVVCPLIEESEVLAARAVESEAARLEQDEFRGYRLGILHGQLPPEEKQQIMQRFTAGGIQVLVTTTVVGVGVDVPNATVMMIEEADRFGLAQLHQLRGRVGRGEHESYCLLFGDPKTEPARRRLEAVASTADGFALA